MRISVLALFASVALATPALAQTPGAGEHRPSSGAHSGHHDHHHAAQPADTAATRAYREINARMHKEMDVAFSNDVDIDFVRGMIPHHLGAVEMAKIALAHSQDPEIRKLAEEVVRAQEAEIAQMRAFLKRRGVE